MLRFNLSEIDLTEIPEENLVFRNAARGITARDDKVLMLRTNGPDYRFPGGIVLHGDTARNTLIREYREEVGRVIRVIRGMFCEVLESREDLYARGRYFRMLSRYWVCLVYDEEFGQRLEEYESRHGFLPEWVPVDDAIAQNRKALQKSGHNYWVERELVILEAFQEHQKKVNAASGQIKAARL